MAGFNSALRKRIRALRVFKAPAFKRHFASPAVRKRLIEHLQTNLKPSFFSELKLFRGIQSSSSKVRSFMFEGNEFIIKDTKGDPYEGFVAQGKVNPVRSFIQFHQEYYRKNRLRDKSKYILRTPKLIAQIGNYLVLERIPHWIPQSPLDKYMINEARSEVHAVFKHISEKLGTPSLQSCDLIPAGKHNGKVVFYSVYDYDIF